MEGNSVPTMVGGFALSRYGSLAAFVLGGVPKLHTNLRCGSRLNQFVFYTEYLGRLYL